MTTTTAHNDDHHPHTAAAATHPHVPHLPDTQKWQTTSAFTKRSTDNLHQAAVVGECALYAAVKAVGAQHVYAGSLPFLGGSSFSPAI
jgi:hypothetical protein